MIIQLWTIFTKIWLSQIPFANCYHSNRIYYHNSQIFNEFARQTPLIKMEWNHICILYLPCFILQHYNASIYLRRLRVIAPMDFYTNCQFWNLSYIIMFKIVTSYSQITLTNCDVNDVGWLAFLSLGFGAHSASAIDFGETTAFVYGNVRQSRRSGAGPCSVNLFVLNE